MSALRRSSSPLETPAPRVRPALGLADEASTSTRNPVLEQHARIATAFERESRASYPGSVKLAIVVGAPLALWSGLIGAGFWLAGRLG